MRPGLGAKVGLVGLLGLVAVVLIVVWEPPARAATSDDKQPMFIRWLIPGNPGDETIRVYWQRVEQGTASPEEMVDLGSMLFYRGYPKDAVRMFKRALDDNKKMYEAWFRIGLVEHREGNIRAARRAYRKCLRHLTGHGWCNFYMGRLQEQLGRPNKALHYYRRAFKFAPELADAQVNPELLYSKLQFAAVLHHEERRRVTQLQPMTYLQPGRVRQVRSGFEETVRDALEPAPVVVTEPTPQPEPTPAPGAEEKPAPVRKTPPRLARPTPPRRVQPTAPSAEPEDDGTSLVRRPPPPGVPHRSVTPPPYRRVTPVPPTGTGTDPSIPSVSPEASLEPLWPSRLERAANALLLQTVGLPPVAVAHHG